MTKDGPRTFYAQIEDYPVPTTNPRVWIDGYEFASRVRNARESGEVAAREMEAILASKMDKTSTKPTQQV